MAGKLRVLDKLLRTGRLGGLLGFLGEVLTDFLLFFFVVVNFPPMLDVSGGNSRSEPVPLDAICVWGRTDVVRTGGIKFFREKMRN